MTYPNPLPAARLAALSLACLAAWCSPAHAADAYLSASLQLSNVQFQLIDLNPNDGVTPSMRAAFLGSYDAISGLYKDVVSITESATVSQALEVGLANSNSLLPTSSSRDLSNTVAITPSALNITSTVLARDISLSPVETFTFTTDEGALLKTNTGTVQFLGYTSSGSVELPTVPLGLGQGGIFSIVLSANTALVMSGQARLDTHFDRTLFDASFAQTGGSAVDEGNNSAAYENLSISLGSPVDYAAGVALHPELQSSSASFDLSDGLGVQPGQNIQGTVTGQSVGFQDNLTADTSVQSPFSVVGFNNTNGDNALAFKLSAQAYAYSQSPKLSVITTYANNPNYLPPSIPEPSTYALMGLGLVGVSLVARRQRPTAKA